MRRNEKDRHLKAFFNYTILEISENLFINACKKQERLQLVWKQH